MKKLKRKASKCVVIYFYSHFIFCTINSKYVCIFCVHPTKYFSCELMCVRKSVRIFIYSSLTVIIYLYFDECMCVRVYEYVCMYVCVCYVHACVVDCIVVKQTFNNTNGNNGKWTKKNHVLLLLLLILLTTTTTTDYYYYYYYSLLLLLLLL